jgi:hypothetical protein
MLKIAFAVLKIVKAIEVTDMKKKVYLQIPPRHPKRLTACFAVEQVAREASLLS